MKPSELAPLSTLRLMELVDEVGFPAGVVNVVIGGPDVGAALVRHPGVQKVAFTGPDRDRQGDHADGRRRAEAGHARARRQESEHRVADANLEAAASGAFGGIFFNQGAACVAGSRCWRRRRSPTSSSATVSEKAGAVRLGSGLDPDTQMGPLISAAHRARVKGYVEAAREQGADVVVGGDEATVSGFEGGFFLEPTVLSGVRNDMKVAQEEIFGPVLSVIPWKDEEELLALANGVDYGLASGIWTTDVSRGLRIADRLDAGTVWINTYGMFDVAVPFGGRKQSGFGKELGEEALEPYLHSKSVWVDLTSAVPQSGQGISR